MGITGNTYIVGNLNIQKGIESNSATSGTVIIGGGMGISGNTYIVGNLNVQKGIESTSTSTGTVIIGGGLGISGNTYIGGNLNVTRGLDSTSVGTGTVIITGGTSISGNTFMGGNTFIGGNISIGKTSNLGYTLDVSGTTNLSGYLSALSDASFGGNLFINGTTPALNPTSGALIVAGGVGIGGNLWVYGNSNIYGLNIYSTTNNSALVMNSSPSVLYLTNFFNALGSQNIVLNTQNSTTAITGSSTAGTGYYYYSSCAISADGKNQIIAGYYQGGSGSGFSYDSLYFSTNYGSSYISTTNGYNGNPYRSVTMSANGTYMIALGNRSNSTPVYTGIISLYNGGTWKTYNNNLLNNAFLPNTPLIENNTINFFAPYTYTSAAISNDGNVISFCTYGGNIWSTYNGTGIYTGLTTTTSSNTFNTTVGNWNSNNIVRNWSSNAMSITGQYQVACVGGGSNTGNIWVSNQPNYLSAVPNWQELNQGTAGNPYTKQNWYSIAISNSGQYVSAVANGGNIWVSNNYANPGSWTNIAPYTGGGTSGQQYSNQKWTSIAISATGQYQVAAINPGNLWMSNNYGSVGSWSMNNTVGANKTWNSVAISSFTTNANGANIFTNNVIGVTGNGTSSGAGNIYTIPMNVSPPPVSIISANVSIGKIQNNYPLDILGTTSITGNLFVTNDVSFNSNLVVGSRFDSTSVGTGALIIAGGTSIGGNTFIGGNLNVKQGLDSTSVGTGTVIISGGTSISGNTFIGGNLNVTRGLDSTSVGTGTVIISGGASISGNTFIGGNLNVTKGLDSTSVGTGTVIISGGASISGNTFMGGNTFIGGKVSIGKTNNSGYGLDVSGTTNLSSSVYAANYLDIESNYLTTLITSNITSGIDIVPTNATLSSSSTTSKSYSAQCSNPSNPYQTGTYTMSCGNTYGLRGLTPATNIFNNTTLTNMYSSDINYSTTSGQNTNITTTYNNTLSVTGDWIQVDINTGYKYALSSISIIFNSLNGNHTIYALGSNDSTWNQINSSNPPSISINNGTFSTTSNTFNINSNNYYTKFRFVFNTIPTSNSVFELKQFKLSGSAQLITPIYPNLNINTTTAITGSLSLTNDASFNRNLVVGSTIDSTSVGTGALIISGGTSIGGNTFIGGNLNVTKGTESTSTTTGTLIVSGGMGLSGNAFIGGNVTINSTFDSSLNSSPAPAALNVKGGVNIAKSVNIGQKLYTNKIQPIGSTTSLDIGQYDSTTLQQVTTVNIANNSNTAAANPCTITIGGTKDKVIIGGSITINGSQTNVGAIVESTPYFLINNGITDASHPHTDASNIAVSGNGDSRGAGIYIADNQDLSSNTPPDNAVAKAWAYIKISQDTKSFIIKPTGYDTTNLTYNTNNRIRIGDGLSTATGINNSLVILQPSNSNAANSNEFDYRIISSQMDLSSILQRDITNSSLTSQQINTDLIIGNTTLQQSMAIGTSVNVNKYSLNMIGNIYQDTATATNGFIIQF